MRARGVHGRRCPLFVERAQQPSYTVGAAVSGYVTKKTGGVRLAGLDEEAGAEDASGVRYFTAEGIVIREYFTQPHGERTRAVVFPVADASDRGSLGSGAWLAGYALWDGGDLFRGYVVYGDFAGAERVALEQSEYWGRVDGEDAECFEADLRYEGRHCVVCGIEARSEGDCPRGHERYGFPCGHEQPY